MSAETDITGSTMRARSFVIRLTAGAEGEWRGQASEPGSPDGWHETFASLEEFWAGLQRRLAARPPPSSAGALDEPPA